MNKKYDEKVFFDEYVDKDALYRLSTSEITKVITGSVASLLYFPSLTLVLFSFVDICNLNFVFNIVFFCFSIFFLILYLNSVRKILKRDKQFSIFKDRSYLKRREAVHSIFLLSSIVILILINLTYILFDFQLFMMLKLIYSILVYFPVNACLFASTHEEVLSGIAKVNLKKLNKEKELKNKIKDEVDIIGIRVTFDDDDKNY